MDEDLSPDPSQDAAIEMLKTESVGVVTGGPGRGKTTVLRRALQCGLGRLVGLVAPTGKAAKRITEVTSWGAETIHRVLGASGGPGGWLFLHNKDNPLPHDTLIIDEASMLSADIAGALMQAVDPKRTRVFFIGDVDQLPSIGAGQVFADIIDSGTVPVVYLEKVHRAALESWVCRNAPLILDGDIDLFTESPDFRYYKIEDPERLAKLLVKLVVENMAEKVGEDIQVLSPQNTGPIGVEMLNIHLQQRLNPMRMIGGQEEPSVTVRASHGVKYHIRARDRVMATDNDYKRNVFNGEIGTVISAEGNSLLVDFGGNPVDYHKTDASGLRLAYALTVHKMQGSEAGWVVVVCHSDHHYMWNRQLLYTAVTRAKKGVVLIGDDEGIGAALNNNDPRSRLTTLRRRLESYAVLRT